MSAEVNPHPAWKIVAEEKLLWRCWQGDYIVFNPLSGNTHLLDIVAGEVLMGIRAGQSEFSELVGRIATFLEVDNDSKLAAHVSSILVRLDELGVIEPADRC